MAHQIIANIQIETRHDFEQVPQLTLYKKIFKSRFQEFMGGLYFQSRTFLFFGKEQQQGKPPLLGIFIKPKRTNCTKETEQKTAAKKETGSLRLAGPNYVHKSIQERKRARMFSEILSMKPVFQARKGVWPLLKMKLFLCFQICQPLMVKTSMKMGFRTPSFASNSI